VIREAVALLLPGAAIVLAVPSLRAACRHSRIATAALAAALGIGLSSVTTTGFLAIGLVPGDTGFLLADASIWAAIGALGWWFGRRGASPAKAVPPADAPAATPIDWIVRAAFGVTAVLAIGAVLATVASSPHGEWDAWAIWNLHARFLFRGGEEWRDLLTIGWSQPDYPLLLPASVARLWAYAGRETTFGPALVAMAFGAASVIVVMTRLGLERRRAWIAGAVLVGSGSFLAQVPSLCADVPVACFMVMTLAAPSRSPPRGG
jgi:hypothetical protein